MQAKEVVQDGPRQNKDALGNDRLKATLSKRWPKWNIYFDNYLRRWFKLIPNHHQEIVADAVEQILSKACDADFEDKNFEKHVYLWLRQQIKWFALKRVRVKRLELSIVEAEDYDPRVDEIQPVVRIGGTAPQQEQVVFLKQVIEKAGSLPKMEKAALREITEQQDLWEIVHELKLPVGKLIALAK